MEWRTARVTVPNSVGLSLAGWLEGDGDFRRQPAEAGGGGRMSAEDADALRQPAADAVGIGWG